MTTDLHEPEEITGVEWIVDYAFEPPQRRVLIDFDTPTLIALADVADAAVHFGNEHTAGNGKLIRDYALRIIQQLERRSLQDYEQWKATEHLDDEDAEIDRVVERGAE